MDNKSKAIIACAAAVACGVVAYAIYKAKKGKGSSENQSQWELYREIRNGYAGERRDVIEKRASDISEEEDAEYEEPVEDVSAYKVVADEKPDISEVFENLKEATVELGKSVLPEKDEDEEEVKAMGDSSYGVEKVMFDGDGIPQFREEDWDSENGNISLISQSEYLNSFLNYNKEQAVWFGLSNVLVDTNLTPIEVVDTVGPTAFTALMRDRSATIFVKNKELETDYELLANDDVTIEAAWEDRGME